MSELGRGSQMREIARLFSVVEEERRYYQDLAARVPQPMALFDSTAAAIWTNEAFRRMFPSEAEADLRGVLPSDNLMREATAILSGRRKSYREQLATSSQLLQYTLTGSRGLADHSELLVQIEDLTEALAQARRAAEVHYGALDAITWELDAERMTFMRVDQATAERLGFNPSGWSEGASFWSRLLASGDLARVRAEYAGTSPGKQAPGGIPSIVCEYRILDRRGQRRWMRDRATRHGNLVRGTSQEIDADKDREQSAARAERIAAQRRLAAFVNHDNNNLLMILRGYGEELLLDLPKGSPLRANVVEIVTAIERLTANTRALAAFTTSQPLPAPQVFELAGFLADVRETLLAVLPAGTEVVLPTATEKARIEIDRKCLEDCLCTLGLSLGGPTRIAGSRLANGQLSLVVASSTGKSPPEHAFEISPALSLGLELHTCYRLIHASAGEILVRENGYEVLLPQAADPFPVETSKDVVLVVDDEESIRSLMRKVLERAGYQVIEAASGEMALAASLEHAGPIQLLLSDVVMPGMGGVELAENLSRRRPELRTLLISGYAGESSLSPARLPRGFEFLQKPFRLPDLLGKVRQLVEQGR